MNRFRIRDNVPDVYVKKSRDFQLLCDLFDVVNNGVKFDIDSIMNLTDTKLTREAMLPYLQGKLGFNTSKDIPQDTLRTLLKCFPYLVKGKGSKKGIIEAICLFLNVIYTDSSYSVDVFNNEKSEIYGNYIVLVSLNDNVLKNLNILDDLLKYILPAGYNVKYELAYELDDLRTIIYPQDSITVTLMNEHFGSKPRQTFIDNDTGKKIYTTDKAGYGPFSSVAGAVSTTIIAGYNDPYVSLTDKVDYTTDTFIQNGEEENKAHD